MSPNCPRCGSPSELKQVDGWEIRCSKPECEARACGFTVRMAAYAWETLVYAPRPAQA